MKAHSSYFQQKNTKRGLALSTAMAISIVLALLVALLISMATLNITTTQDTVNQRDAYIQAKSAISFAESYYSTHSDQIPGKETGGTYGEAIMVFNGTKIADGAKVYITKTDASTTVLDEAYVTTLKEEAPDTYVEIVNTGSTLVATAYCKYGDSNAYELSKQFDLQDSGAARGDTFTGNITYTPTSDTRYLRIHVRTSEAFINEPYIYTWGSTTNANPEQKNGKSAIVNKLAGSASFPNLHFSGEWDPKDGPTAGMQYEGNGWYLYEIEISTQLNIEYINAIVTRKGAVRDQGDESQSWEFFGIPVPSKNETGKENGADVYITLNQSRLLDARNDGGDPEDKLTAFFQNNQGANVDNFAQFSSIWYTVYTKKDSATLHFRAANTYTSEYGDDKGLDDIGFTYEGYGWWRSSTNDLGASVEINGNTYYYYSTESEIISQNEYGKELVVETFACEYDDGFDIYSKTCGTEAQANEWFVTEAEDVDADDYVTVYVRANEQPVKEAVATTISYESKVIEGAAVPTPDSMISTDSDTADADSDPDVGTVSYEADADNDEPQTVTLSNKNSSTGKLNIQNTGTTANVQSSGAYENYGYAIAGDGFNNWGLNDDGTDDYNNLHTMENRGGYIYSYTYENLEPGIYEFKVVEKLAENGTIIWHDDAGSHSWGNGGENYVINVTTTSNVTIFFNYNTGAISVTGLGSSSGSTYAVVGWLNDWGLGESSKHYYQNLDDMHDNGDGSYTLTVPNLVSGGATYEFKIIDKPVAEGAIEDKDPHWSNSWGGSGDSNYAFTLPGGEANKFLVTITFFEGSHDISVHSEEQNLDDGTYYLVGQFNNWADGHTSSVAAQDQYKLQQIGVDDQGNTIYKYTIGLRSPGTEEIKVISSAAVQDVDTINYEYSWGQADSSGVTYGSDKAAYSYTVTQTSTVEVTFTVNAVNKSMSKISVTCTPYNYGDDDVVSKSIGFYNNQLVNVNDTTQKTDFTTPWSNVYVTYFVEGEAPICLEVNMSSGGDIKWGNIPSNTTEFYFSNGPIEDRGLAGYEYTDTIDYKNNYATSSNPVFFPKKATTGEQGKLWSLGGNEEYSSYAYTIGDDQETNVPMAYAGDSSQKNYYDIPIVKLLEMMAGDTRNYAFSSYPYKKYETPYGDSNGDPGDKENISFTSDEYGNQIGTVTYQNETYYYATVGYQYSYLIVNDADIHGVATKGGILFENHFALMSDTYGGVAVNMDNRGGGVFTSDGTYYNGTSSHKNYGGYTPSWYSYKIHASTSFKIKNIKGVTAAGDTIVSNSSWIDTVKADTYYNQPIYIYKNGSDDAKVYTYNTDIGKVDTSDDSKVSVYFNNTEGWSKVYCYAYGLGPSTATQVTIDSSNADKSYYKFTFNSGEYAYFVFYNGDATCSDGSKIGNDASSKLGTISDSDKTDVLYLTGEENEYREYAILANGAGATEFTYFLHPKTAALYAFQEARSAYNEAKIFERYTYNSDTYEYTGVDVNPSTSDVDLLEMSVLKNEMEAARYYAGIKINADDAVYGGPWSASESSDYSDLAAAAREFSKAITNARIYIADDPTDPEADSDYIFLEYEYRDDILEYTDRWVDALKVAYDNAMSAYSDTSKQNAASLYALAADINAIIAAPETSLSENAVQIIVDDQADDDGNGHWGKDNIQLYNRAAGSTTWTKTGFTLYDTTQTDFYAFVFKMDSSLDGDFYIARGDEEPDSSTMGFTVERRTRYMYDTATRSITKDDSDKQVIITTNEITETSYSMYAMNTADSEGNPFELYFKYDTTVNGGGVSYVIRAGSYTISKSTYGNFNNEFPASGEKGIYLFTENAKNFFEDATRYGMSGDTTDYSAWSDTPASGSNIDIMCDAITISGDAEARTAISKRVNFRFKNEKNNDKLSLSQNVLLEAGTVTVAANNIKLNGKSFDINAKTIIFYTDTKVTTSSGSYTILHGTYVFNEVESSSTVAEISLNDKNWTDNYTLVDQLDSTLRGGKYVAKK